MTSTEQNGFTRETGDSSASSLSDSDTNPPSSVQKSIQLSDRLDFSHVDGGKKAAKMEDAEKRRHDAEKRKLETLRVEEGLEEGEVSTDSEFEAPRKLQKTDKMKMSESIEGNSSGNFEDTSSKTEDENEGDTTLMESQNFSEEFHIVDDAEIDDDEENDVNTNVDSDDELDDNEIYAWLEEGIEKQGIKSSASQEDEDAYSEREKIILTEIGRNPFEVLPEGWVMVTHNSGMPIYLHRQSRVCTASKPYFLGSGSVRKHSIPISGIPCLHYRREKDKKNRGLEPVQTKRGEPVQSAESVPVQSAGSVPVQGNEWVPVQENGEMKKVVQNCDMEIPNGSTENPETEPKSNPVPTDKGGHVPAPEIKTLEHTEKEYSIEPDDLHEYCKGLFDFKTITVKKFKSWKEKRRHLNKIKIQSRPSLPSDIKLITCPVQPADKTKAEKTKRKEFVLNPVGKTPLCILHEYVQHVLRVQPEYTFKELECAATPYSATVKINKIDYATGLGASKKQAKLEAAKKTLEILIPHLQLDEKEPKKDDSFGDLSFFDEITVEDPRIADLCNKAALNKPYQVLQECLKRNYGMGESKIMINKKVISNQKSEFTITVGKHTASVVCKNKREGKQMAAQAMLQLLHPHIKSWGSILRLYSENTIKGFKEKDEEPVTQLQSKHSSLNAEILKKLKDTMRKLSETREQFASKGTLRIAYRVPQSQVKNIDL